MGIVSRLWLNWKQNKLAFKLLLYVVLCSSILTLLTTGFQLYTDYQKDLKTIQSNLRFIEESYLPGIETSLYTYNEDQLRLQLKGALKIQDIVYLEIEDIASGNKEFIAVGEQNHSNSMVHEFPLVYKEKNGKTTLLGKLLIIVSLEGVYQRLIDKVLIILFSNLFKTFLASIIILAIIQWLITRHLQSMAEYANKINISGLKKILALRRKKNSTSQPDELDMVVNSINDMRVRLQKDILEREKAEKKLKESEERYRQLYQNANEAICIAQDGKLVFFNPMTVEIIGYSSEKLLKMKFSDVIHPEDKEMVLDRHKRRLMGENPPNNYLFRIVRPDNSIRWMLLNTVLVEWEGKAATLNFISDTTDRKYTEEQIKSSLKEKETLLQEIHHRVKNNMQVISSLLRLQSNNIDDVQVKDALKDSQSRVYAMSAVHETLHGSENLSEIDLKKYLSNITTSVFQTYSVNPGNITLHNTAEKIPISINQASPMGLIINELLSNSLKYAFPDERKGEINVQIKRLGKEIELTVMDDGIGMPKELDPKNANTLGLKLVRTLVEDQLDGTIDMESQNGTKFTIKFKIEQT